MLATRQKFGKFVLLESIDTSGLGSEARAAQLGPVGLERIVTVLQLSSAIAANAEVAESLMEQVRVAAQLQSPNILKIYGIGRVDSVYYISYEFVEGKSLKEILARCRRENLPLSVDHALIIAGKVCSALDYAHSRGSPAEARYFHGLLTPSSIVVSYDGKVHVRGFGYWPSRIHEVGALTQEDTHYLAPEQLVGGMGDTRSDVFAVGAILFELLTGQPLFSGRRGQDLASQISKARLWSPADADDPLPRPITQILQRALAEQPAHRFGEIQEMRKAIDALQFSGDFTPTTFTLASFMPSLFGEDIERESRLFKEEKEDSFQEFLMEETARIPKAPRAAAEAAASKAPSGARAPRAVLPPAPAAVSAATPPQAGASSRIPPPPEPARTLLPKEAASTFTFHKEPTRSRTALLAGIAALFALGTVGYYFGVGPGTRFWRRPPSAAPAMLTAEALALRDARVKELEEKVASLEATAAAVARAAAAKAVEEATKRLEAEAAARGHKVEPAALLKAQEDARRMAEVEQVRKLQDERTRLEEAKAAAEVQLAQEQRSAEEQRKAEETVRVAAAAPTPALAPPTLAPASRAPVLTAGSLVALSDPGVIAPVAEVAPLPNYPPLAYHQRVEGTVELNALVDENGSVTDTQVITGAGGRTGLNEAAIESVKRRRYRPALKDGVPVKVWVRVRVKFELPRSKQERNLQEERERLEHGKMGAEAPLAQEPRKAEEPRGAKETVGVAAATPRPGLASPTLTPANPAPALTAGTLVELSDPGVTAPVAEIAPLPSYPPLAYHQRVEGAVELNVLVDENGRVTDTQVITGAGGKSGLNEAAMESVKRRRYRPARKDGVPVKVWVRVRVTFELPR